MSKARLVITAVVVEGRNQSEVARDYGVSQSWISRLLARYSVEGDGAFGPRSRRPHTTPTRLPQASIDLIIELREKLTSKGLDNGPETIGWNLKHHHGITVSTASIIRHLRAAGLVTPAPKKRPKTSYIRFAAELPNERWQADFTHWWLADQTHTEILCLIDDSRYALSVTAHLRVTGPIVLAAFRKTCELQGIPASTLTLRGPPGFIRAARQVPQALRLFGSRLSETTGQRRVRGRNIRQRSRTHSKQADREQSRGRTGRTRSTRHGDVRPGVH